MTIQPTTQQKVLSREEIVTVVRRRQQSGERAVFTNGCFDLLHLGHIRYLQEARNLGDFLILGLNSDESVRRLKGPTRPLVSAQERAEILAALTCIDYVTIFPEPTAGQLIDLLQPAIYVKGADYATPLVGDSNNVGTGLAPVRATSGDLSELPIGATAPARGATDRDQPCPYEMGESPYLNGTAPSQDVFPDASRLPEAKHVLAYGGTIRLIAYLPNHSTTELIQRIKRV